MIIKNVLLATEGGLGNGETPIFPIHIFKVKEGVNYNPGDPNYDLFKLACRVSAKRLFPNFSFLDAPFNACFYKEGKPETEIAYMGCRTRVISNVHDPERQIVNGRGNLSFTSVNLPRLAIPVSYTHLDVYKRQGYTCSNTATRQWSQMYIGRKRYSEIRAISRLSYPWPITGIASAGLTMLPSWQSER